MDAPLRSYATGPGVDNAVQGRIVAHAIRVHAGVRIGDRESDGDVSMHEVVPMRAFYEAMQGGSVTLRPDWHPGQPRLIGLDQAQFKVELTRMRENYVIARQNGKDEFVANFYGADEATQMRTLHAVMLRMVEAWTKLMADAAKRIPADKRHSDPNMVLSQAASYITQYELDQIASIADPGANIDSELVLPEAAAPVDSLSMSASTPPTQTPDDIQKEIDKDDAVDPSAALLKRLGEIQGVTETQAMELALAVDIAGKDPIKDEDITRIVPEKKLAAVRRALKG
jgi:hypothetical protein